MKVPDCVFNSFSPFDNQEEQLSRRTTFPSILHVQLVNETQIRVCIGVILSAYTVHSIDGWGPRLPHGKAASDFCFCFDSCLTSR